MELTYLSLFAGIGGLDLGLDRAGWRCVGQVERDPFCRTVLDRHWPEVPKHDDVRTTPAWWTARPRPLVHLVAGGPPCQAASRAGHRRGAADDRWGWPWFLDTLRVVRPRYALMENPAALLDLDNGAAFGGILAELAALGFDAWWSVLPACAFGAPHTRGRLFVVAYPHSVDGPARMAGWTRRPVQPSDRSASSWADPVNGLLEAARRRRRMADGVSDQLEPARVRALGNAVVPAVAEYVGRLIATHTDHQAPR